jgi:hypothetical protein
MGNDLTLIKVPGLFFRDLTKYLVDMKPTRSFPGRIESENITLLPSKPMSVTDTFMKEEWNYTLENLLMYSWKDHAYGKCGTPVIGFPDDRACVVGVHSFCNLSSEMSGCSIIEKSIVMKTISDMEQLIPCKVYSEGDILVPESVSVIALSEKHCFNYEDVPSLKVIGSLKRPFITPKTNLENFLTSEEYEFVFQKSSVNEQGEKIYQPPIMKPISRIS